MKLEARFFGENQQVGCFLGANREKWLKLKKNVYFMSSGSNGALQKVSPIGEYDPKKTFTTTPKNRCIVGPKMSLTRVATGAAMYCDVLMCIGMKMYCRMC